MTLDEFFRRHGGDYAEFVNGRVVILPPNALRHGLVCATAAYRLGVHVEAHQLGHITTNNSFVLVPTPDDPTRVRGPDICYFSHARMPKGTDLDEHMDVTPELIFEVMSPSDLWTEVFTKVGEYLANGVLAVVVLNADKRSASVCRPGPTQEDVFAADTLTLPDVLPGFAVPVARLFD